MNNAEQAIEKEIQAKELNAPRITPAHIDSIIKNVEYILPREVCKRDNGVEIFDAPISLQTLTLCILSLKNGFTVTGESACVSLENFNAEMGKKLAYDNARNKIWMLEGYLLSELIYQRNQDDPTLDTPTEVEMNEPPQCHSTDGLIPNYSEEERQVYIQVEKQKLVIGKGRFLLDVVSTTNSGSSFSETKTNAVKKLNELIGGL